MQMAEALANALWIHRPHAEVGTAEAEPLLRVHGHEIGEDWDGPRRSPLAQRLERAPRRGPRSQVEQDAGDLAACELVDRRVGGSGTRDFEPGLLQHRARFVSACTNVDQHHLARLGGDGHVRRRLRRAGVYRL